MLLSQGGPGLELGLNQDLSEMERRMGDRKPREVPQCPEKYNEDRDKLSEAGRALDQQGWGPVPPHPPESWAALDRLFILSV